MIPLIGYADRLSLRPGETIGFKVSSQGPAPYDAKLVRVICGDPNPDGPGIKEKDVPAAFAGSYPSRVQTPVRGSYISAPADGLSLESFTVTAVIWPTRPDKADQGIVSRYDPDGGNGFALALGPNGAELRLGGADSFRLAVGKPFRERAWYQVCASYDAASGAVTVGQQALGEPTLVDDSGTQSGTMTDAAPNANAPITIAAIGGAPVAGHFNGKIEAPALYAGAVDPETLETAAPLARWDFSQEMSSMRAVDTGPNGWHGALVQAPARAMTGSNWTGDERNWTHAPETYGAIHFHEDDVADCDWVTDFTFTVPDDLPSGAYAARLSCGDYWEAIPFFVCPPKGTRTADLCVLVSTFTYVIYGNQARVDFGEDWKQRATDWGAFPWNPMEHREFGLSTYNHHTDGSGICHASWRRPMLNVRPGYFPIFDARGSGLRHMPADTHLTDWLEEKGIAFDVVTDWELHHDGVDAIAGYKAVITGSHPEYHTTETLDALTQYRDDGGNFAYLGGNGFYWRVALHPEMDGLIEVRRAEGGIRAWAAEPGEYYQAFDGNYGGIWRRNNRPPQQLAGVGFSAQGLFEGTYYRRAPGADDPRTRWIFEGVSDEIIGDFGLSGGGAAGFELDRTDRHLGTPENAVVLAVSENPPGHFVLVPEEWLTHVSTIPGGTHDELTRADMTYFDCPGGGAVFSVGSITFCGSLSHDNYDNNVSRILENVLKRFLA
ncbi:MAG: N,N-dimethylformamidase large subunit [Alphaproteobacteria bacterium]|nr:N,N-dimethylformamidase large subunit [Alphaproteobacteria bacterium]